MKKICVVCGKPITVLDENRIKLPFKCKSCSPSHGNGWSAEEINTLVFLRTKTTLSMAEIAKRLGMKQHKVVNKVDLMKLKKPKKSKSFGERRLVNGIIEVRVAIVSTDRKERRKRSVWIPLKDLWWFVNKGEIPEGYKVKIKDLKSPQDSPENIYIDQV